LPGHRVSDDSRPADRLARASICKWGGPLVTYSRQQIVEVFRRAGMDDIADAALATLPEQADYETADKFCAAHHLTVGFLMDRLGSTM
jgi:hypothetical protein